MPLWLRRRLDALRSRWMIQLSWRCWTPRSSCRNNVFTSPASSSSSSMQWQHIMTRRSQHLQQCHDQCRQWFVAGWLRKTPCTEKPTVCLLRVVNVSWQQHRLRGSDAGETPVSPAWLVRRGTAVGKTQHGFHMHQAALLRSVWRPT